LLPPPAATQMGTANLPIEGYTGQPVFHPGTAATRNIPQLGPGAVNETAPIHLRFVKAFDTLPAEDMPKALNNLGLQRAQQLDEWLSATRCRMLTRIFPTPWTAGCR